MPAMSGFFHATPVFCDFLCAYNNTFFNSGHIFSKKSFDLPPRIYQKAPYYAMFGVRTECSVSVRSIERLLSPYHFRIRASVSLFRLFSTLDKQENPHDIRHFQVERLYRILLSTR